MFDLLQYLQHKSKNTMLKLQNILFLILCVKAVEPAPDLFFFYILTNFMHPPEISVNHPCYLFSVKLSQINCFSQKRSHNLIMYRLNCFQSIPNCHCNASKKNCLMFVYCKIDHVCMLVCYY